MPALSASPESSLGTEHWMKEQGPSVASVRTCKNHAARAPASLRASTFPDGLAKGWWTESGLHDLELEWPALGSGTLPRGVSGPCGRASRQELGG